MHSGRTLNIKKTEWSPVCYILKERAQNSCWDIFCHVSWKSEEKLPHLGISSLPACADSRKYLHLKLQSSSCWLKLEFHSVWGFCLFFSLLQGERKLLFPPDDDSDMPMEQKPYYSCILEELSIIATATVLVSAQSGGTGEKKGF